MLKPFLPTLTTFMLLHFLLSALVSSQLEDTLKPGENLNSSSALVSSQGTFELRFYAPNQSNLSYLAIFYARGNDMERVPVWIGNRNTPVSKHSSVFTISNEGKLLITHAGAGARADPIVLFAAETGTNIAATLLDSGNLVVKEIWPNGSSHGEILWQSFDHPTDILLPGMKLGVNHRTGRTWTLTSWVSNNNPASGVFTLQWDPISRRLVVSRRGIVRWTSGDLKLYFDGNNLKGIGLWTSGDLKQYIEGNSLKLHAFDDMRSKPNPEGFNYIFTNVTNQYDEYFTISIFEFG